MKIGREPAPSFLALAAHLVVAALAVASAEAVSVAGTSVVLASKPLDSDAVLLRIR